jgi:hypothetical protein
MIDTFFEQLERSVKALQPEIVRHERRHGGWRLRVGDRDVCPIAFVWYALYNELYGGGGFLWCGKEMGLTDAECFEIADAADGSVDNITIRSRLAAVLGLVPQGA